MPWPAGARVLRLPLDEVSRLFLILVILHLGELH